MRNLVIVLFIGLLFTSCGTLFTSTKQPITFVGQPETSIFDHGKKLGRIGEDGETTIKIKKRLSNKVLIAKKEGYKTTAFTLNSVFNPVSIINLTNILAWAIDLGTGKCCKWDDEVVTLELEEDK